MLVAPTAFKGTLSARQAAIILAREIRHSVWRARVRTLPLADGGDGTIDALAGLPGAVRRWVVVRGPRGVRMRAPWLWFADRRRAVVEMARASGLALVPPPGRNPERTTSYGTGQLIDAARRAGAREIWVGLGGTATVDGGAGLLQAMGLDLYREGQHLTTPATGGDLHRITRVETANFSRRWAGVRLVLLTDVRHCLNGHRGAARVFGPQKGATRTQVVRLARGLQRWADLLIRVGGRDSRNLEGGGAAGGAAAGVWSLTRARVVPGARWIARHAGLEKALAWADLLITGEGRVDRTSFEGKTIGEAFRSARKRKKEIILVTGGIDTAAKPLAARTVVLGPVPRNPRAAARTLARRVRVAFHKWEITVP